MLVTYKRILIAPGRVEVMFTSPKQVEFTSSNDVTLAKE